MDISVIICTYNRSESLRRTLQTFCELEIPDGCQWELIVVDNNSPDTTKIVCEEFVGKLPLRYCFEPRQGKSNALNLSIGEARAELLAFTDDDVDVDSKWLANIESAACRHPHAMFFGGRVLPRWEKTPPRWAGENLSWLHINAHVDFGDQDCSISELHSVYGTAFFVGANIIFRKEIFHIGRRFRADLGPTGMDDSIGGNLRGEEIVLQEQLKAQGIDGFYIPNAVVYHRHAAHRQTELYLCRFYMGSGVAAARCNPNPMDASLLGAPRFLWRIMLSSAFQYVAYRWTRPPRIWLSAARTMAMTWGKIVEYRRQSRVNNSKRIKQVT